MIAFKEYLLDMMDVRIDAFPEMACSLLCQWGPDNTCLENQFLKFLSTFDEHEYR